MRRLRARRRPGDNRDSISSRVIYTFRINLGGKFGTAIVAQFLVELKIQARFAPIQDIHQMFSGSPGGLKARACPKGRREQPSPP
jgi:hypothetical protein